LIFHSKTSVGRIFFSQFIDRIAELGVTFCHADPLHEEITLYLASDNSRVISAINEIDPIPPEFSAKELERAIYRRRQEELG
jgi:hypothetical protein